jgi:sortase A
VSLPVAPPVGPLRRAGPPLRAGQVAAYGAGELMITVGTVLLLFVVWQLWWTDVVSDHNQGNLTRKLQQEWGRPPDSGPTGRRLATIPMGDAFALIRVPRFGRRYVRPVVEGVGLDVLRDGVGHYPDSVRPGRVGNFAVAGHRVTYGKPFNQIAELRAGDPIVVETRTTWYVYRVARHTIVSPTQVDVVAPVPERPGAKPTRRMMTMTACHPMFSAAQRYVVFSRLEQTLSKASGAVPDVLQ